MCNKMTCYIQTSHSFFSFFLNKLKFLDQFILIEPTYYKSLFKNIKIGSINNQYNIICIYTCLIKAENI